MFCGKNEKHPYLVPAPDPFERKHSRGLNIRQLQGFQCTGMKFQSNEVLCHNGSVHLPAFCVWVLCYLLGLETEKGGIQANM